MDDCHLGYITKLKERTLVPYVAWQHVAFRYHSKSMKSFECSKCCAILRSSLNIGITCESKRYFQSDKILFF